MFFKLANEYETSQIVNWSLGLAEESSMGFIKNNQLMSLEMLTETLKKGGYYVVAVNGHEILGWIMLVIDRNFYSDEMVGFIYDLYVWPKYRKNRIGEQLINQALFIFKNTGLQKVNLNVFAGNPAKRMYEKLGFYEVTSLMEYRLN
ncbi:GNAT family N-acetyltransferase [Bacillus sp. Marseille-P3661]|uniref:GNAT family N-acetyltransferase n=1 Tax=Bacillus sp. Marseille-P3661 TaxID=1936234 RepID=UPI000C84E521|nr:GNAT family N-acetyltransferase [Bacillus sp. Marseille-P3661]